jgi:hypothetical protein
VHYVAAEAFNLGATWQAGEVIFWQRGLKCEEGHHGDQAVGRHVNIPFAVAVVLLLKHKGAFPNKSLARNYFAHRQLNVLANYETHFGNHFFAADHELMELKGPLLNLKFQHFTSCAAEREKVQILMACRVVVLVTCRGFLCFNEVFELVHAGLADFLCKLLVFDLSRLLRYCLLQLCHAFAAFDADMYPFLLGFVNKLCFVYTERRRGLVVLCEIAGAAGVAAVVAPSHVV